MIYLFHGPDGNRVRGKALAWVQAARVKAPDAFYVRLEADEVSTEALSEALGMQGLFFSKTLIVLNDPFSLADTAALVLDSLSELAASPNIIALIAPKLIPARVKKVGAVSEKVFSVEAPAKTARGFNSLLVNALGAKDKALLWKEIVKAYRHGDAPEAVHGLLHWKARDIMQKGSRAWSPTEARVLSRNLILLLSDSRGKDIELGPALERFALSLSEQKKP